MTDMPEVSKIGNRLRRIWSESIGAKLTFGIVGIVLLTVLSIGAALFAFRSVSTEFDSLQSQQVPEVRRALALLSAAEQVSGSLLQTGSVDNLEAAGQAEESFEKSVTKLLEAASAIGIPSVVDAAESLTDSGRALQISQAEALQSSERQARAIADLVGLGRRATEVTRPKVEAARKALDSKSAQVIDSSARMIAQLTGEEFEKVQSLLQARAEANLLSGAAISISLTEERKAVISVG